MPPSTERYLIEGATFREDLEPELVRLLKEIWNRRADVLRPCWIVVPAASLARHLKTILLGAGVPLLNVEFLTLTLLRERLEPGWQANPPLSREKQELLLRCLLADSKRNRETAGMLLEAVDLMRDSGHPAIAAFDEEGRLFRPIVEAFERRIGPRSVQVADRHLLDGATDSPKLARDTVIYGFDAGDWPAACLLLAAARSSGRSAVFLRTASGQIEGLEMSWTAWWEQNHASNPPPGKKGPQFERKPEALCKLDDLLFVPLREARAGIALGEPIKNADGSVCFFRHATRCSEVRASAALAACWSAEGSQRVALIFAGADAASRIAVAWLKGWGVLFEDQLGSPDMLPAENAVLKTWLRMQEEGAHAGLVIELASGLSELRVDSLMRRELADDLTRLAELVEFGRRLTLSDQVQPMARALGKDAGLLGRFAGRWGELAWPASGSAADMERRVCRDLEALFGEHAYELESSLLTCFSGLDELLEGRVLDRTEWVRYLEPALDPTGRVRQGAAYAPVAVTSVDRSRGQCFDAAIFCGLNEGYFPRPVRELPLHLDFRARDLDAAVSRVGEDEVRRFETEAGPLLHLGARRGLERQRFADAVSGIGKRIAFSCFVWDDLEEHAAKEPSELFDWAWWARFGFQSREDRNAVMASVEALADHWSREIEKHLRKPAVDASEFRAMEEAVRERFDPVKPFSAHQFVFDSTTEWKQRFGKRVLNVTAAEKILADPAGSWLGMVLGVDPRTTTHSVFDEVGLQRGSLVHQAVGHAMSVGREPISGDPLGLGRPGENARQTRRAALESWIGGRREAIRSWFGGVPFWWEVELAELRAASLKALNFFANGESRETAYAVELALGTKQRPFDHAGLSWAGSLDHVIRDPDGWKITDLKTGGGAKARKLEADALLEDGEGFQLVQYGLMLSAVSKTEASTVALRYFMPRLRGGEAAVEARLADLEPASAALGAYLRKAWAEGLFGQRPDGDFERPLAHLSVPGDVLHQKWALTDGLKAWSWKPTGKAGSDEQEAESD